MARQQKKNDPTVRNTPKSPNSLNESSFIDKLKSPGILLFLLGFLLYANTFSHDYALDDAIAITENDFTLKGLDGVGELMTNDAFVGYFGQKKDLVAGGRYRPLSMVTFAIEISVFGADNPGTSHMINALLYGLVCLLLYQFLSGIFPPGKEDKWWLGTAFLATLLFAVHPLHTEVVANIKGRDEIMALLFSLLTLRAGMAWIDQKKPLQLGLSFVFFLLALLSKESAIPFLAIIPLTFWFFRTTKIKDMIIGTAPALGAFVLYMVMRQAFAPAGDASKIPTEILNDPFIGATLGERLATVSHTLGKYLALQIFPHPLSHDYYYNQIPIIGWGNLQAIIPALIYLGMGVFALLKLPKRNPVAYGLIFYFATLSIVSNIFFSIGVTMGERFVFIPSIGIILVLVLIIKGSMSRLGNKLPAKPSLAAAVILLLISAGFAIKTFSRNAAWKDNETLFLTDVAVSGNSAKLRTAAGGVLVDKAKDQFEPKKSETLQEALVHLNKATEIYPDHGQAWLLKGNAYHRLNKYPEAVDAYKKVILYRPAFADAYRNLAVTYGKMKDYRNCIDTWKKLSRDLTPADHTAWFNLGVAYDDAQMPDSALFYFQKSVQVKPDYAEGYAKAGMAYGKYFNNLDQAIANLQKAIDLGDNDPGTFENLGISYAMKQDFDNAIRIFEQGKSRFPNSANLYFNLGITYQNLGNTQKAQENLSKAAQLDPQKFGAAVNAPVQ